MVPRRAARPCRHAAWARPLHGCMEATRPPAPRGTTPPRAPSATQGAPAAGAGAASPPLHLLLRSQLVCSSASPGRPLPATARAVVAPHRPCVDHTATPSVAVPRAAAVRHGGRGSWRRRCTRACARRAATPRAGGGGGAAGWRCARTARFGRAHARPAPSRRRSAAAVPWPHTVPAGSVGGGRPRHEPAMVGADPRRWVWRGRAEAVVPVGSLSAYPPPPADTSSVRPVRYVLVHTYARKRRGYSCMSTADPAQ